MATYKTRTVMDIKEIVLKAGYSTVPAYWLSDEKPVACSTSNFEKLVSFAEALFAELAKQTDPVAWGCPGHPETFVSNNKKQNSGYQSMVFFSEPLYTFPPDKAQIAIETAEAIAKMFESGSFLSTESKVALAANGAAKAIRRGAWKELRNDAQ